MSLLGADCLLVDRSTGAEPSLKSHADRSVLNCGVVLAGDGFRRSEAGDPAYIPYSLVRRGGYRAPPGNILLIGITRSETIRCQYSK